MTKNNLEIIKASDEITNDEIFAHPDYADYIMLKFLGMEWDNKEKQFIKRYETPRGAIEAARITKDKYGKNQNWIPSYIESTKLYGDLSAKFQAWWSISIDENFMQQAMQGYNQMNEAQEQIKAIAANKGNFVYEKFDKDGEYIGEVYDPKAHVNAWKAYGDYGVEKAKLHIANKKSKEEKPLSEITISFKGGSPMLPQAVEEVEAVVIMPDELKKTA